MSKEAMKLALEALEDENSLSKMKTARDILRAALAKQSDSVEQGETLVPLRLEWEKGYPEDVACGTQRQMDRLKKWLDKYFAMVQASKQEQRNDSEQLGEPVAWCVYCDGQFNLNIFQVEDVAHAEKARLDYLYPQSKRKVVSLYTTPYVATQRQPVTESHKRPSRSDIKPLTDEQMWNLWNSQGSDDMTQKEAITFAKAIEAAHGISKE